MKAIILTVGTNPLPVYVSAAYYLQKENYTDVFLLHSESQGNTSPTKPFAEAIEKLLKEKFSDRSIKLFPLDNISNAGEINKNQHEKFKREIVSPTELIFNYTGGTKAMSVHIYMWFRANFPEAKFSYLNPREDEMFLEEYPNDKFTVNPDNKISEKINLTIEELAELHLFNYHEKNELLDNNLLQKIENYVFGNFDKEAFVLKNKLSEKLGFANKFYDDDKKKWVCNTETKEKFKDFVYKNNGTARSLVSQFNKDLPEEYKVIKNDNNGNDVGIHEDNFMNNFDKITQWVSYFANNKDLEHYCYKILEEIKSQLSGCTLVDMNWVFAKDAFFKPSDRDKASFELDVLVIFGYRLYVVSVTRQSKIPDIKRKGFEVLLRARQIGGEEAKAVIFADIDGKENRFKEDLEVENGAIAKNIILIDYKKCKSKIIKDIKDKIL